MIEKRGSKFVLLTRNGSRVLGTHPSYAMALAQERAIEASKHARGNPAGTPREVNRWAYDDSPHDPEDGRSAHLIFTDGPTPADGGDSDEPFTAWALSWYPASHELVFEETRARFERGRWFRVSTPHPAEVSIAYDGRHAELDDAALRSLGVYGYQVFQRMLVALQRYWPTVASIRSLPEHWSR